MSRIKNILRKARDRSLVAVGRFRARLPNIKKSWNGDHYDSQSDRHAVYVHFDQDGEVFDFTLHALAELQACGYSITFVTNSPKFPQRSVDAIKPLTRLILHRYNSGYDFAAYRDGIRAIDGLKDAHSLILMNDSVYGPLYPLKDALEKIDSDKVDVWGITDSWEHNYHIQTYFILFYQKALNNWAFWKFWDRLPNINNKFTVISHGELKLSNMLSKAKLRLSVQCPYREITQRIRPDLEDYLEDIDWKKVPGYEARFQQMMERIVAFDAPFNTSHVFWEVAITDWDCLFLKRELIQKNPLEIPFVWRWREVVEDQTSYDVDMIEQHLRSL